MKKDKKERIKEGTNKSKKLKKNIIIFLLSIIVIPTMQTFIDYNVFCNQFSGKVTVENYENEVKQIYYNGLEQFLEEDNIFGYDSLKIVCESRGGIEKIYNNGINAVKSKKDVKVELTRGMEKIEYDGNLFKINQKGTLDNFKILKIQISEDTEEIISEEVINYRIVINVWIRYFLMSTIILTICSIAFEKKF